MRDAAGALDAWGFRRGDRVALYLENTPTFIAAYLAALWLGGVVVPVNTRYRALELRHLLLDSGARLVVTDAPGKRDLQALPDGLPGLEGVVQLAGRLETDVVRWQHLAPGEARAQPVALGANDLALIAYTSGTTGRSKGAVLTHGNLLTNSAGVTEAWGWTADDHLLLALPLFHIHGLGVGLHGTLLAGATLTLKRKFEAGDAFGTLLSGSISMFFGVPTMYHRLLEVARQRPERPQELRLLVSGSAPLNPQTLLEVERDFGLRILERYGMTETVMNLGNPLKGERKPGSVGVPFAGVMLRLVNPATGHEVTPGETGELQLRGPNVFKGYWQNEEATRKAFTADGWFKTGDLGYQDEDGYTYLSGRAKELIISGGFNVYPREVEEVLLMHAGVREVAVLGLPDPDLGERVVAVVVAANGLEAEALKRFCKARLAGFKAPKCVFFVAALPRNALGKVQKHLLKDRLEQP